MDRMVQDRLRQIKKQLASSNRTVVFIAATIACAAALSSAYRDHLTTVHGLLRMNVNWAGPTWTLGVTALSFMAGQIVLLYQWGRTGTTWTALFGLMLAAVDNYTDIYYMVSGGGNLLHALFVALAIDTAASEVLLTVSISLILETGPDGLDDIFGFIAAMLASVAKAFKHVSAALLDFATDANDGGRQ